MVITEADGDSAEAARAVQELHAALEADAVRISTPESRAEIATLWRWRDGVSLAVAARRGGKVSEDIVVPVDRLAEAIEGTLIIGRAFGLSACSWGHAGDGNLHSTFLVDTTSEDELRRAHAAARELDELAIGLGGSMSGEHGVGWLKRGRLALQLDEGRMRLHREIKQLFDPKGLLNPGKKN
jgi:FAD/FMN-containing dehydrogenase